MRGFYLLLISFGLATFVAGQSVDAADWRPVAAERASDQREIILIQHEQAVPRLPNTPAPLTLREPNLLLAQAVEAVRLDRGARDGEGLAAQSPSGAALRRGRGAA